MKIDISKRAANTALDGGAVLSDPRVEREPASRSFAMVLRRLPGRIAALMFLYTTTLLASDVVGIWMGVLTLPQETLPIMVGFYQEGTHVSGMLSVQVDIWAPADCTIAGDKVIVNSHMFNNEAVRLELTLTGDRLQGTLRSTPEDSGVDSTGTVKLLKDRSIKGSALAVTGDWFASFQVPRVRKSVTFLLHLMQNGTKITGQVSDPSGKPIPISHGTIRGESIGLAFDLVGSDAQSGERWHFELELTAAGNHLYGKAVGTSGTEKMTFLAVVVRQPD